MFTGKFTWTIVGLVGLTSLALGVNSFEKATPASKLAPPTEFLTAALREQAEASGKSLKVEYVLQRASGEPKGKLDITYTRTPNFLVLKTVKSSKQGTIWQPIRTLSHSYCINSDEHRTLETWPGGKSLGTIRRGFPVDVFSGREIIDPSSRRLPDKPIDQVILADGKVGGQQENIDGYMCWRVEIPGQYVLWLDSSISFCPRRIDYTRPFGTSTLYLRQYQQIEGKVWFPMEQVDEAPGGDDLACLVSEVQIDTDIPESELQIVFPAGTLVRDMILNAEYTVP